MFLGRVVYKTDGGEFPFEESCQFAIMMSTYFVEKHLLVHSDPDPSYSFAF